MLKKKKKEHLEKKNELLEITMLVKIKILIERLGDKVGEIFWKGDKELKNRREKI